MGYLLQTEFLKSRRERQDGVRCEPRGIEDQALNLRAGFWDAIRQKGGSSDKVRNIAKLAPRQTETRLTRSALGNLQHLNGFRDARPSTNLSFHGVGHIYQNMKNVGRSRPLHMRLTNSPIQFVHCRF
jgi:hypothetical protein